MPTTKVAAVRLLGALAAVLLASCSGSESRKAGFVSHAEQYIEQGNLEKARVELRNALQLDPKYAKARYLAGTVAERSGNIREALGQYQAAVDADPKYSEGRAALARVLIFGGATDKGMQLLEEGFKLDARNTDLLTVRGLGEARLGHSAAALEDAEAAHKLSPTNSNAVALLAALYKQLGRKDKAIEMVAEGISHDPRNISMRSMLADLELARDQPDKAEAQLREIVRIDPKTLAYRYNLARFYLLQHNADGAERTLREAIAADPKAAEPRQALVEMLAAQRGEPAAEAEIQQQLASASGDTSIVLAYAAHYEQHNNAARAKELYDQVVGAAGTKSDGLSARDRLAAMALRQGDLPRATELVAEVLKENARDADALVIRASVALSRGDAPAAVTDLRAVLRDQPNSVPLLRALARAHQQNHDLALAEETLRSALQNDPRDAEARYDLAQLLVQSNRADQAKVILSQLATETPTSSASDLLFRAQMMTKDYDGALQTAQQIEKLRPAAPDGLFYEGLVQEAGMKLDAATAAFERALQVQPQYADALAALVRLDVAGGHIDRAIARLGQVLAKYPDFAVACNLKGELLLTKRDYAGAAGMFQCAADKMPKWFIPYRGLALAKFGAKQTDAAVAALRTGIERSGNAELFGDLATLYKRSGRTEEAIKAYEEWLAREPRSVAAANNLAILLVNQRQDPASLARARALLGILADSDDPHVLDTRAWVLYKNGDTAGGLPLLQQAVDKVPDSGLLRYHLAVLQFKSGDAKSARANLQLAIDKGGSFDELGEARTLLRQIGQSG